MQCSPRADALVSRAGDRFAPTLFAAGTVALMLIAAGTQSAGGQDAAYDRYDATRSPSNFGRATVPPTGRMSLADRIRLLKQKRRQQTSPPYRTRDFADAENAGWRQRPGGSEGGGQRPEVGGWNGLSNDSPSSWSPSRPFTPSSRPGLAPAFRSGTYGPGASVGGDLVPIGHSDVTPVSLQPQTPGEIPQLVPEQQPPEQFLLPQPPPTQQQRPGPLEALKRRLGGAAPISLKNTYGATTWVFGHGDDFGLFDAYIQGTFLTPWLPGFAITPSFQAFFLEGPSRTDLPPHLFSTKVDFRQQVPLTDRLFLELALTPGVFSDFEVSDSDSFRLLGRALGIYQWSQYSQLVAGILYLDRKDIKLLPSVGWIYVPRDDLRLEFLFPRPKLAMRFSQNENYSRWGYILGEFGGGSWAIERVNGMHDVASYRDWRAIFGFEQRYVNGRSLFLETGIVFHRQLEYAYGPGDFDPDTTGMFRLAVTY